jgi:O6-methylguanine-DNA--protein-cysteine methyltransferase
MKLARAFLKVGLFRESCQTMHHTDISCFTGKVTTYKDIARVIGSEGAFRAVGSSLKRNPFAPQVSE